jgi:hypothetical protein
MATSNASTKSAASTGQDEVDKMFGEAAANTGEDAFAGVDDLLDEVEEDDSEGWVPKERNEGIAGIVVKLGETRSDFAKDGDDPMCPTVTIQTSDGTKWRVIGYGSVLKRELQDANPQIGDMMAVKYFGEKPIKTGKFAGKPYKHFGVVVRRKAAVSA